MLIFSTHEMKFIWYLPKKVNFLFILYLTEIQKSQPYFLLIVSRRFDFCSVFIGYNIGCKRSLHLENGLEHILTNETQEISI